MKKTASWIYLLSLQRKRQLITYMSDYNNRPGFKFSFRAIMHIVIGVLYIVLAAYLFKVQQFGTVQLGPAAAYGLGALLMVYGGFRIWRGVQDARTSADQ